MNKNERKALIALAVLGVLLASISITAGKYFSPESRAIRWFKEWRSDIPVQKYQFWKNSESGFELWVRDESEPKNTGDWVVKFDKSMRPIGAPMFYADNMP